MSGFSHPMSVFAQDVILFPFGAEESLEFHVSVEVKDAPGGKHERLGGAVQDYRRYKWQEEALRDRQDWVAETNYLYFV